MNTPNSTASTEVGGGNQDRGDKRVRYRFPPSRRLQRAKEYERVFAIGRVFADGELVIHAAPNGGRPTRLGLAVSRRLGKSARRNRIKRLIREAFRLNQHQIPPGLDLVVGVRKEAQMSLKSISASLLRLTRCAARECLGNPFPPGEGRQQETGE